MATVNQAQSGEVLKRVLALLVGLAIMFFLFFRWGEDMTTLVQGGDSPNPGTVEKSTAQAPNPALAACLEKRLGDVNKMKDQGVLSDHQFATFSGRATQLCKAQNPQP